MAGGSPFELFNIYGMRVQRYRLAGYMIAAYAGIYVAVGQYNSFFKKTPQIVWESKEQEQYVAKYVKHAEHEAHKPELARDAFAAKSGLY